MPAWLKRSAATLAALGAALGGAAFWAAGGRQYPGRRQGEVTDYGLAGETEPNAHQLTVMTWNIAYARGPNPDNRRNQRAPREVFTQRLSRMGALIKSQGADIVLLQEVDFDAKRSHRIDQLAALATHSGLRYAAPAESWRANYVPFPYWPPSQHYGRVVSGGAVLSRFPITTNQIELHPKPLRNPWWYNLFYLFRYSQCVTIGARRYWLVNNHLEAFDRANRVAQAEKLAEIVAPLADSAEPPTLLVVGGDLNTVPPEARKQSGFVDEPEDDYRNDRTLPILRQIEMLQEIIPIGEYRANEAQYFTFPAAEPTRRLDYLLLDRRLKLTRREIVQTNEFSDHKPVVATFTMPSR